MFIFGQKSCFFGPNIKKIPQLKWCYCMVILDSKYIYSLVLVKAIGHSDKTRFSPPQPLGHPSEESTSHFCEFVVVKQTWSKTPSLSQSTIRYWALLWLQPSGLLQLLPGVTELSGISVTKKVKKSLCKLILNHNWFDLNPGIDFMILWFH